MTEKLDGMAVLEERRLRNLRISAVLERFRERMKRRG